MRLRGCEPQAPVQEEICWRKCRVSGTFNRAWLAISPDRERAITLPSRVIIGAHIRIDNEICCHHGTDRCFCRRPLSGVAAIKIHVRNTSPRLAHFTCWAWISLGDVVRPTRSQKEDVARLWIPAENIIVNCSSFADFGKQALTVDSQQKPSVLRTYTHAHASSISSTSGRCLQPPDLTYTALLYRVTTMMNFPLSSSKSGQPCLCVDPNKVSGNVLSLFSLETYIVCHSLVDCHVGLTVTNQLVGSVDFVNPKHRDELLFKS